MKQKIIELIKKEKIIAIVRGVDEEHIIPTAQALYGQCQMTYEKTSQRKKAQMNLENCRYFMLWQLTATLDGTKKNCCR